jgi:predicted DNA-binding antitoxin AbrB/MazE fold protein
MNLEVEATYEDGVLKPSQALPLQEGQKVNLTVQPVGSAAKRFCGSLRWTRDPEELRRYLNDPDRGPFLQGTTLTETSFFSLTADDPRT